ncbi:MAG TPA: hypothetical protein VK034_27895, partial [Enhygromyxa sp.]|nr:hypothetical protein [Enhygromyxa sp.]
HPLVAASYNNMGEIRRHQNDPTGALAVVEQALAIEAIEGTRTELVSRSLARDAHRMLGQLEQARMHIERLLELPEELYPPYMTREGLAAELEQIDRLLPVR